MRRIRQTVEGVLQTNDWMLFSGTNVARSTMSEGTQVLE